MATTEMNCLASGGGLGGLCEIDTTQQLGSITTEGGAYTPTKNCGMVCNVISRGYSARVYVDNDMDKALFSLWGDQNTNSQGGIGIDGSGNLTGYAMFIPSGTTVYTRSATAISNTYNVRFFELA